jgi:hypothetical protein
MDSKIRLHVLSEDLCLYILYQLPCLPSVAAPLSHPGYYSLDSQEWLRRLTQYSFSHDSLHGLMFQVVQVPTTTKLILSVCDWPSVTTSIHIDLDSTDESQMLSIHKIDPPCGWIQTSCATLKGWLALGVEPHVAYSQISIPYPSEFKLVTYNKDHTELGTYHRKQLPTQGSSVIFHVNLQLIFPALESQADLSCATLRWCDGRPLELELGPMVIFVAPYEVPVASLSSDDPDFNDITIQNAVAPAKRRKKQLPSPPILTGE